MLQVKNKENLSLGLNYFNGESYFLKKVLPWIIIGFGVFLRIYHYIYNRSLFGDEAYIANSIINRGFIDLLEPLEYNQRIPIGYILIVELFSRFLGINEYGLRLFSLLSGIASLVLFYKLFKPSLQTVSLNIGLAILSFSPPLIYYSSELKQYITELSVSFLLYLSYVSFKDKNDAKSIIFYALTGALAIWFSFPAIFILVGIAIGKISYDLINHNWSSIRRGIIVYSIWAISFLFNYFFFVKSGTENEFLQNFWQAHFMPFPFSFKGLRWIARMVYQTLDTPLGLDYSLLAVIFFFIGMYLFWKQQREYFWILVLPFALTLIASGLEKYPFHKRFLLFLAPVMILFISVGAEHMYLQFVRKKWRNVALLILLLLVLPSVFISGYQILRPDKLNLATRQDIRPVIEKVIKHKTPGDKLLINDLAFAQFRYYNRILNVSSSYVDTLFYKNNYLYPDNDLFFKARFNRGNINYILKNVEAKRVWLLFARNKNNEEESSIEYMNAIGVQKAVFKDKKASAYLYEINVPKRKEKE